MQTIDRGTLESLAPANLPTFLEARYRGDGESAALRDFPAEDRQCLLELYHATRSIYQVLQGFSALRLIQFSDLEALRDRSEWRDILRSAQQLGESFPDLQQFQSVIHDIRGGSLTALLGSVEILEAATATPNSLLRICCYARDHLKIMRNAIPDLDPERTALDEKLSPHSISLLKEKWFGSRFAAGEGVKEVKFECDYAGSISSRCMEFSALDRIIYNLMNNASKYGTGPDIGFDIFLPAGTVEANVRFVLQNNIGSEHRRNVLKVTDGFPGRLFSGGLTTSGSGLGLRICADFVVRAFGLKSVTQAVAGRYLGAELIRGSFVTWFHWPRV